MYVYDTLLTLFNIDVLLKNSIIKINIDVLLKNSIIFVY